jgi:predicted metal-binding transcription factor (methanogenesis marker protein 9)
MSRPEKPIDWKRVDELLMCGCLGTEIAACFDMHPTTFYERVADKYKMSFTNYMSQKRSHGDTLLREAQHKKALKGDNSMLIWLGKNRLGQKDQPTAIDVTDDVKKAADAVHEQLNAMQSQAQSKADSHVTIGFIPNK